MMHLIPRYQEGVDELAGGVRFVIPSYGNYREPGRIPRSQRPAPAWLYTMPERARLARGGPADPFVRHLRPWLAQSGRHRRRLFLGSGRVEDDGKHRLFFLSTASDDTPTVRDTP